MKFIESSINHFLVLRSQDVYFESFGLCAWLQRDRHSLVFWNVNGASHIREHIFIFCYEVAEGFHSFVVIVDSHFIGEHMFEGRINGGDFDGCDGRSLL